MHGRGQRPSATQIVCGDGRFCLHHPQHKAIMACSGRFGVLSARHIMVPLVYSPKYNITMFGLERRHPFDGRKYGRIHDWLIRQGLRKAKDFVKPRPSTHTGLREIHAPAYLRSLRDRRMLARLLEVPMLRYVPAWLVDWRVLSPMRWATGGTMLACRLALEKGLAINLGGGYHHASPGRGGGFCAYADVPLALHALKQEGRLTSALVVDTDAHQGDGTAQAIRAWPWAHLLDLFEQDLYPWPKADEEMPVPLPPRTGGAEYLDALREHLPRTLDRYHPDLVVYNAGSDVLASDPLSALLLTADDLAERDLYVATEVRERGVPLAMVLSGGYGPVSWLAHAKSIEGILARFDHAL
ncbi:MAG TPA: histone deacetylase [Gemmataceae bacterium]|nr:histone deacetylase [Gemmataceae bacterium]